jgi:hypothetical protein
MTNCVKWSKSTTILGRSAFIETFLALPVSALVTKNSLNQYGKPARFFEKSVPGVMR